MWYDLPCIRLGPPVPGQGHCGLLQGGAPGQVPGGTSGAWPCCRGGENTTQEFNSDVKSFNLLFSSKNIPAKSAKEDVSCQKNKSKHLEADLFYWSRRHAH